MSKKKQKCFWGLECATVRKKKGGGPLTTLSNLGCALGRGLLAGLAGTIAITAAQHIEMQLTGRAPSNTPEKAGAAVLGVEPKDQR
jgi:hypothetical protein